MQWASMTAHVTEFLLTHNPLRFTAYARWGADLTLCGHIHGGRFAFRLSAACFRRSANFFQSILPEFMSRTAKRCSSVVALEAGLLESES